MKVKKKRIDEGVERVPLVEDRGENKLKDVLVARKEARAKKDFAASDRIRDELAGMGYAIKDMPQGRVEVRRA